jgi:hypothetical protein
MKFSTTNFRKFSAELFRKSTVIFPEISGKIPQEISGNFRTHNQSSAATQQWLSGSSTSVAPLNVDVKSAAAAAVGLDRRTVWYRRSAMPIQYLTCDMCYRRV